MGKVKCPICNTEIEDDPYQECPYCGWAYTGIENCYDPDEIEDFNKMSANEAKHLLSVGKNVWGDPLPKK